MTKYRFSRGKDGTITIRAERILGKQLVSSITRVLGPDEDVSTAMKKLYEDVHRPEKRLLSAHVASSERGVGT